MLTKAHGDRDVLRLEANYPDPQPAPGRVVVAVAVTAVNYHDIFTRRGMPGIKVPLPVVVGSDVAGTVLRLGEGVQGWAPGDRVLINPIVSTRGEGMLGEMRDGGRAELVAVDAEALIRVPENVTLEAAAALPLAYGTAYRMLVTRGRVKAGERLLVLGASGGVGAACVQIGKVLGAEVIACASSAGKLERLGELGADHLVNYVEEDFAQAVKRLFGKPRISGEGGVDVAVNFTGGDTMLSTQRSVRLGGRILTCGATAGHNVPIDARYWWTFEHDMIGSNGWTGDDLTALLDLIAADRFQPLIDRVLPLEQTAEAERLLEDREVIGKVLIRP